MAAIKFKGTDGQWHPIPSAGPAGKSAYELAVSQGYTGTLAEWLAEMLRATDIANNLTTEDAGKVLSALQGKLLNDALADKQAAITSDNAATVRSALGLKNGALRRVECGSVTVNVPANESVTESILFSPSFAESPNVQLTLTTSVDPKYYNVCISSILPSGFTIKVSGDYTAPRNVGVHWQASSEE